MSVNQPPSTGAPSGEGGLLTLLLAGGRWWMFAAVAVVGLLLAVLVALQLTHGVLPAAYTVTN